LIVKPESKRTRGKHRRMCSCFVTKPVFTVRSCQHLAQTQIWGDHPLSAVRDCLFNIFAPTLLIGGHFSTHNLRTRHAVVTGTHLSIWRLTATIWVVTHS